MSRVSEKTLGCSHQPLNVQTGSPVLRTDGRNQFVFSHCYRDNGVWKHCTEPPQCRISRDFGNPDSSATPTDVMTASNLSHGSMRLCTARQADEKCHCPVSRGTNSEEGGEPWWGSILRQRLHHPLTGNGARLSQLIDGLKRL